MALTIKQLNDVCLLHKGPRQCSYLEDEVDHGKIIYWCSKLSPPDKKVVEEEMEEFLDDCKKFGKDPLKEDVPMGDNCKGFLPFKNKPQGYDLRS